MDEYPKMLYKCPGPHEAQDKVMYDYRIANDVEAEAALAADGWSVTLADANKPAVEDARSELEKQAKELGIKFDGRTTDSLLQERIDEALAK